MKLSLFSSSLRCKLIAPFILGTALLAGLLSWHTSQTVYKAVNSAMLSIAETQAKQIQRDTSTFYEIMQNNLRNLSNDPHLLALFRRHNKVTLVPSVQNWIIALSQGNSAYKDISVLNVAGVCIASTNPTFINLSFLEKNYVHLALSGMMNISNPSVGKVSKQFTAVAASPIEIDGKVHGVLVIHYSHLKFIDYSHQPDVVRNIYVSLLSKEGLFIAHNRPSLMGNTNKLYPALYKKFAPAGEKGRPIEFTLDGKLYKGYVLIDKETSWAIIASGLESDIFAPAREVALSVLCISMIFLTIISFVVVRFANNILGSLFTLIEYAKKISEGAVSKSLPPSKRKDELGVLHTSLQRLVEALQKMVSQSNEASKLKSEFLANMSHEIRTPLNAIVGMAHLSLRQGNLPEKQQDYMIKIQMAAHSLLGVINDILDLSKVEADMLAIEETPFNLHSTLENILSIHLVSTQEKDVAVTCEIAPGTPCFFLGDELRISQVLNNLLSNAIKFTNCGSVAVQCWQGNPEYDKIHDSSKLTIYFSVTDTGIGISPESQKKLFQPFMQADASTSRKFGGTGLGLAISNRLVQAMGGHFSVSSNLGQGSTFTFCIRLLENQTPQPIKLEAEDIYTLPLAGKHILIAEDNPINQMIVEEMLAPTGAVITIANNGKEAVDAVIANPSAFDLILMDMQMPVLDGLQATAQIRTIAKSSLPIIALTANAMEDDRQKCMASGMNGFLAKPIDPAQLLSQLKHALVDRAM